jgi:hypothetical protein
VLIERREMADVAQERGRQAREPNVF